MLMVRERVDPVAARLRDLEKALYGTEHGAGTLMADRLGISVQRWHRVPSHKALSPNPGGAPLLDQLSPAPSTSAPNPAVYNARLPISFPSNVSLTVDFQGDV